MIAIRGATTIELDSKENITSASVELLSKILMANDLTSHSVVCLMISTTSDIKSFYPARAIREAGYSFPLYSSLEPEIDGALKNCIRFMLLVDSDFKAKHIYLHRAKSLRKDLNIINIAIDGPAGSGKSTVAKLVANKLQIPYLDTGAMYRAAALFMINKKIDLNNDSQITQAAKTLDISIKYKDNIQLTLLNGEDVSEFLRTPSLSMAASKISQNAQVRYSLAQKQRDFAQTSSCVLDGRDIASFVLPNADFKFYLTAESFERAKRRFNELKLKGIKTDLKSVEEDIISRDFNDSNRKLAPLVKTDDAILIDTTTISAEQAAQKVIEHIGEN